MQIKLALIGITIIFLFNLTSCASYDFSRRVVEQGNLLSVYKVQSLKIGMSKDEVSNLLGTSLLSPTFDNNRWDYAYSQRRGNEPMQIHSVSLYFMHDHLIRIVTFPPKN